MQCVQFTQCILVNTARACGKSADCWWLQFLVRVVGLLVQQQHDNECKGTPPPPPRGTISLISSDFKLIIAQSPPWSRFFQPCSRQSLLGSSIDMKHSPANHHLLRLPSVLCLCWRGGRVLFKCLTSGCMRCTERKQIILTTQRRTGLTSTKSVVTGWKLWLIVKVDTSHDQLGTWSMVIHCEFGVKGQWG